MYVNTATDDGLRVGLVGGDGLQVDNAPNGNGVNIYSAGDDGVYVSSAGDDGVHVESAAQYGVYVAEASDGLYVYSADDDGVAVNSADDSGVFVNATGGDGIRVCRTGTASSCTASTDNNGIEIGNAQHDGVVVTSAGDDGLYVNSVIDDGLYVNSAGGVGVYVCRTGSAASCSPSSYHNGVEVGNAQDDGLHVRAAGKYGLYVNSAGYDAIRVAGTNDDGLDVTAAHHGVNVSSAGYDGLHVSSASDNGVDVTGNNLAGYFNGSIQVTGTCTGCLLSTFAVNTGDRALAPGDLVSLTGLRASGVDSVPMLMEVQRAGGSGSVVGVVQGWAELVSDQDPRPGEIGLRLAPREGAAGPGQYVTIAYSGMTQVAASGPVAQGSKLAAGSNGIARDLRTLLAEGVEPTDLAMIGVALEGLDSGDGLIWVLVNLQ